MRGFQGKAPLEGNFSEGTIKQTEPAVVAQRAYDWRLWVIPKAEKFPRSYRFTMRLAKDLRVMIGVFLSATFPGGRLAGMRALRQWRRGWVAAMRLSSGDGLG